MPETAVNVTMRIRHGSHEIEVTGPVDFVERKIAEFEEQTKATGGRQEVGSLPTASGTAPPAKSTSPAQFFKAAGAKSDVARALVAGYFLERVRNVEKFTAADIREVVQEARQPPPNNPSDVVNQNIRKGLMMAAGDRDGKMAYVLTGDGEEAVEKTLSSTAE